MIVEVVSCSVEDCIAIERAGAHRVELCAGIVAGGVTPSTGLVRACVAATRLPIMAMIRPREGGFHYSAAEYDTMCREVDALGGEGVAGVVFGILSANGAIDSDRMADLRRRAGPMEAMCHRAFDVTPDPFVALDTLVDCGFDRVLSSGQRSDILAGLATLGTIMNHARGRIEVQPCEGIRPANVRRVIEAVHPSSIHLGPFRDAFDPTSKGAEVDYGTHLSIDSDCVEQVVGLTAQV